jgi:hypothetical protein
MNRIRLVAAMAACLVGLGGCFGFGKDVTEAEFIDHIKAGMIEQDVFVEKVPGSNEVFRVGKSEAGRFADAPVYRTTMPVNHAPFSPRKNGPYPKGASLGMSLGDWLRATGKFRYTCTVGEKGRIEAVFKDLVPNGTYTMWYFRVAKAHMGCADCPFATIDFPIGAKDGSQSIFIADARGFAEFDLEFEPCLKPGDDQLAAALAVAYHSDGNTHGPSPGDRGSRSHVHLFAMLANPDDE